jgi:hypothetical protein
MITKTVVRPYKGTDQWEADVFMLVNGKEVRRRWRSPMPSKLATERWAREKAKGFLADSRRCRHPQKRRRKNPPSPPSRCSEDYAVRWMNEYVIANRHSPATSRGTARRPDARPAARCSATCRSTQIGPAQYQKIRKDRGRHLDATTVNKICDQLATMLHVAVEWKLIVAAPKVKRLKAEPKEMPCLTPEEGEKLVETALEFGAKFHLAALLGVDGGLRNSEIIGLRWSGHRLRPGEIVVQQPDLARPGGPAQGQEADRKDPAHRAPARGAHGVPARRAARARDLQGHVHQDEPDLLDWFKPIWAKAQVPRGSTPCATPSPPTRSARGCLCDGPVDDGTPQPRHDREVPAQLARP